MLSFGVTLRTDQRPGRFLELLKLAEAHGFEYGWTFDSHILGLEAYPLLTMAGLETKTLKLGLCVTSPGTREPTVTASIHATLQQISRGRMVMGIGRGDSSMRMIGLKPVRVADFERAIVMMRELMNGRPATWNGTELVLEWARGQPEIPIYVAAYGPKALGVAGRVGDGVIVQLADPEILQWIMGIARRAAADAGRDPNALRAVVCAPAYVSEDMSRARDQTRWFPAMVSNHVVDLLRRYKKSELPASLADYVERRTFYDYRQHGLVGATHAEFVDDETCDRFSLVGPPERHVEQLRRLEAAGAEQLNIYLQTEDKERTLDAYSAEIIPALDRNARRRA